MITLFRRLEVFLRRYKETIGILTIIVGIGGLLFSYWTLRGQQADEITNTIKFYLEEKDSDISTVRVITEYAQSLPGYVIEKGDLKADKKLKRSTEASALYKSIPTKDDLTGLREQYIHNFFGFQLNSTAVSSMESVLNQLLSKRNGDKEDTENDRLRSGHGNNIVIPQLRAKAASFDPTEKSAALVLSAHLVHPPKDFVKLEADDLKRSFTQSFLGYIDYDESPLNLSEFDLSESDFFEANFKKVDFSSAALYKTNFDRVMFADESKWNNANKDQTKLDGPQFRGVQFSKDADFANANIPNANFSTAPAIPATDEKSQPQLAKPTVFSSKAIFKETHLESASFADTYAVNIDFTGAYLTKNTNFKNAYFWSAVFKSTNFGKKANFNGFQYVGNGENGLRFEQTDLSEATFGYPALETPTPKLDKALFKSCNLSHARFDSASLAGATFKDCTGTGTTFGQSTPMLEGGEYTNGAMLIYFKDASALTKQVYLSNVFVSEAIAIAGKDSGYIKQNIIIAKEGETADFVSLVIIPAADGSLTVSGEVSCASSQDSWTYSKEQDNVVKFLRKNLERFGLKSLVDAEVKAQSSPDKPAVDPMSPSVLKAALAKHDPVLKWGW